MASIMDGERQFHIRTIPDEVGRYVIMPTSSGIVLMKWADMLLCRATLEECRK
ncbi:hypothetical protein [Ruminococcus sp.]|uniref:hypothetical protein n=1 Tax=Ruminococcus sp. TaxID=41978 RepID=UPI00396739BD